MTEEEMIQIVRDICLKWDVSSVDTTKLQVILQISGYYPTHEFANVLRALADLIDSPVGT